MYRVITLLITLVTLLSCEKPNQSEAKAEAEVRQSTEAYNSALNRKDMDTLLDFWSDEAVYRNPVSGKLVQGKESIKKEYFILFNEMQNSNVEMKVNSISFPFDDKAVVEGVLSLKIPGEKPFDHDYTIIFVKRNGKWKILNISEINLNLPSSKAKDPLLGPNSSLLK